MNNKKIYLDAADLIDKYGWIQYKNGNYKSGFCLDSALFTALAEDQRTTAPAPAAPDKPNDCHSLVCPDVWPCRKTHGIHNRIQRIRRHLSETYLQGRFVTSWNDRSYRTKDDVHNLLIWAANDEEEKEEL